MCSITVCFLHWSGQVGRVCMSFNGVMVSVSVCSAVCVDWGPCIRTCASSPYHRDVAQSSFGCLEWFGGGPPSPPSRVSRQLTLTVGHASNARGDANTADTTAAPYHVWASPSNFDWEAPRRLRAAPIVVGATLFGDASRQLGASKQRERRHVNSSAHDVWARPTLTERLHVVCGPLQPS